MMNDSNVSYAVPCEAIRVFVGFPNASLSPEKFLADLGSSFMPGTPYMLQPLGLAAYLPAAIPSQAPDLPSECALIAYASAEAWDFAMHKTLRGRIYNQTHGGVYAFPSSGAAFPVYLDKLPPGATDPFYLFPKDVDWQLGVTWLVVGKSKQGCAGTDFSMALREAFFGARSGLAEAGVDQAIVTWREGFAIAWLHLDTGKEIPPLAFLDTCLSAAPITLQHERIKCSGEPPSVAIMGDAAFNFIFLRDDKNFLF